MSKPRSMLPPRKKDAIPGRAQIGLFIRFKTGSTIESVTPMPTEAVERGAEWLLHMIACAKGCKLCRDLRLVAIQSAKELKERIEAQRSP